MNGLIKLSLPILFFSIVVLWFAWRVPDDSGKWVIALIGQILGILGLSVSVIFLVIGLYINRVFT